MSDVATSPPLDSALAIKVPVVITLFFWIIKILATTVGETGADHLIFNLHFGLPATSVLMTFALDAILWMQVRSKRYNPWLYWLTVVMVSIVGTLITDNLTDYLNVPLAWSSAGFSLALLLTFGLWYRSERSLSIHSIDDRPGDRASLEWTDPSAQSPARGSGVLLSPAAGASVKALTEQDRSLIVGHWTGDRIR